MVAIPPQSMTRCTPTNNNFIFHRFDHKTNTSKDIIRLESRDAVGARGVPDPSGFPDQGDGGCTLGFFPENRNIERKLPMEGVNLATFPSNPSYRQPRRAFLQWEGPRPLVR